MSIRPGVIGDKEDGGDKVGQKIIIKHAQKFSKENFVKR